MLGILLSRPFFCLPLPRLIPLLPCPVRHVWLLSPVPPLHIPLPRFILLPLYQAFCSLHGWREMIQTRRGWGRRRLVFLTQIKVFEPPSLQTLQFHLIIFKEIRTYTMGILLSRPVFCRLPFDPSLGAHELIFPSSLVSVSLSLSLHLYLSSNWESFIRTNSSWSIQCQYILIYRDPYKIQWNAQLTPNGCRHSRGAWGSARHANICPIAQFADLPVKSRSPIFFEICPVTHVYFHDSGQVLSEWQALDVFLEELVLLNKWRCLINYYYYYEQYWIRTTSRTEKD